MRISHFNLGDMRLTLYRKIHYMEIHPIKIQNNWNEKAVFFEIN